MKKLKANKAKNRTGFIVHKQIFQPFSRNRHYGYTFVDAERLFQKELQRIRNPFLIFILNYYLNFIAVTLSE